MRLDAKDETQLGYQYISKGIQLLQADGKLLSSQVQAIMDIINSDTAIADDKDSTQACPPSPRDDLVEDLIDFSFDDTCNAHLSSTGSTKGGPIKALSPSRQPRQPRQTGGIGNTKCARSMRAPLPPLLTSGTESDVSSMSFPPSRSGITGSTKCERDTRAPLPSPQISGTGISTNLGGPVRTPLPFPRINNVAHKNNPNRLLEEEYARRKILAEIFPNIINRLPPPRLQDMTPPYMAKGNCVNRRTHIFCPYKISPPKYLCHDTASCRFAHNEDDTFVTYRVPLICPHWIFESQKCVGTVCDRGLVHGFAEHLEICDGFKQGPTIDNSSRYQTLQRMRVAQGLPPLGSKK